MPLSFSSLGKVGRSDLQGGGGSLLAGGCVHKVGEDLSLVEEKLKSLGLVFCLWEKTMRGREGEGDEE